MPGPGNNRQGRVAGPSPTVMVVRGCDGRAIKPDSDHINCDGDGDGDGDRHGHGYNHDDDDNDNDNDNDHNEGLDRAHPYHSIQRHCSPDNLDGRRGHSYPLGSFLRSGSRYHGTQQSGRCTHEVTVEIKTVDAVQATLTGYLRIQGLTQDHEILTTYFEGEIVSDKYSFFTNHPEWGATAKTDLAHWSRFTAFHQNQSTWREKTHVHSDYQNQEFIFMRWKERFFVPDSNVTAVEGASYAGFYYICFNQVTGGVSGFYYHQRSEKYQQLELAHLPDSGNFYTIEFR